MSSIKAAKAGIVVIFFLFTVVLTTVAQPGDPEAVDPDVPITGIEVLLGMGGLYGAKKFLDLRKKK